MVINFFQAPNEIQHIAPGIRATGGGTEVGPASEGAAVVNQALAHGVEHGTGAVGLFGKLRPPRRAKGARGHDGFSLGEQGGPASEAELAS